jgi:hypothetical protein
MISTRSLELRPIDKTKPLLLIDCHGTMLHRSEDPVPEMDPDLFLRDKYLYLRKDLPGFLKTLAPLFNICIYSSIMAHNIKPVLHIHNLFPYVCKVFDRIYCKPDPEGALDWYSNIFLLH